MAAKKQMDPGKKLVALEIEIGGFFGGYKTYSLTAEKFPSVFEELDRLVIRRWRKYYDNPLICDGTQWTIKMSFADGSAKEVGGSNLFPRKWNEFARVVAPALPGVALACEDDWLEDNLDRRMFGR